MQVDEIRLIFNGVRRIILLVKEKTGSVVKFEETLTIEIKEDSAVVAEVIGRKSLYPCCNNPLILANLKTPFSPML